MADAAPRRGGFGSRGDRGGDRGRGRGRRGRRGGAKSEEKEWQPVTKLGRLVKAGKITSMEQIYLHSLPVKEYQIVDFFLPKLKDEVMKVRLDLDYRCWISHSQLGKKILRRKILHN
jgi:small subunit ribosomal protein S2e